MTDDLKRIWQKIIIGDSKSWVLFKNGTCVILMEPEQDLHTQAKELMSKWGPVYAGSPAGDFSVIDLAEHSGWVVTCHYPDILTYVSPDEIANSSPTDLKVGLLGRGKRDLNAQDLEIIHVEDKRPFK